MEAGRVGGSTELTQDREKRDYNEGEEDGSEKGGNKDKDGARGWRAEG